jgi:3'-5' exonuclease
MTKPTSKTKPPARPAKSSWLQRVARLFQKSAKTSPPPKKTRAHHGPPILSKAETALLPPFPGLPANRIHVPHTQAECEAAAQEILAAGVAGFDTEARPTFRAGEKSTGPHVVQFALTDKAYVFQLHRSDQLPIIASLIESERVLKVGFGLKNDHGQIRRRLGVKLHHVLDLDQIFRKRGHKDQIGVRRAMADILHLSFPKSKSITTSNWAAPELTPSQLKYAANDAYAALKIMEALKLDPTDLPKGAVRH